MALFLSELKIAQFRSWPRNWGRWSLKPTNETTIRQLYVRGSSGQHSAGLPWADQGLSTWQKAIPPIIFRISVWTRREVNWNEKKRYQGFQLHLRPRFIGGKTMRPQTFVTRVGFGMMALGLVLAVFVLGGIRAALSADEKPGIPGWGPETF
jgi:hypothetical protein